MEDLAGALQRPEEHPCVHLANGIESELERGYDREAAAAAAERPEEIGFVLAIDMQQAAVGGHDVCGEDAVAGEAVGSPQPAETPAKRVAHHSDIG